MDGLSSYRVHAIHYNVAFEEWILENDEGRAFLATRLEPAPSGALTMKKAWTAKRILPIEVVPESSFEGQDYTRRFPTCPLIVNFQFWKLVVLSLRTCWSVAFSR